MLIVVEGIDGAGKATQCKRLLSALTNDYSLDVGFMSFPRYDLTRCGAVVGEFLRGEFGGLREVHPKLAALPFALDRWESRKEIEAHLTVRDVLLLDRYTPSNMAHQAAKITEDKDRVQFIEWLYKFEHETLGLPKPDMVICLDLPADLVNDRVAAKATRGYIGGADIHEADAGYQHAVRVCFRSVQRCYFEHGVKWRWIECGDSPRDADAVHSAVMSLLRKECRTLVSH